MMFDGRPRHTTVPFSGRYADTIVVRPSCAVMVAAAGETTKEIEIRLCWPTDEHEKISLACRATDPRVLVTLTEHPANEPPDVAGLIVGRAKIRGGRPFDAEIVVDGHTSSGLYECANSR